MARPDRSGADGALGHATENGSPPRSARDFRLVATPNPGWRGYVDYEVLEVVPRKKLRFSWDDDGKNKITYVTCSLEAREGGTRLAFDHTGFAGVSGFIFAKALMTPGIRSVLDRKLPAVLAELDDDGARRVVSSSSSVVSTQ